MSPEITNMFDHLMETVPSTKQIGFKARFVRFNGQIIMIPEAEFMALAHVLAVMWHKSEFTACVFDIRSFIPVEDRLREMNGGKLSEHLYPTQSIRKLAKRGILTWSRHTVAGQRHIFEYVVTLNGNVSLSDCGILCIG